MRKRYSTRSWGRQEKERQWLVWVTQQGSGCFLLPWWPLQPPAPWVAPGYTSHSPLLATGLCCSALPGLQPLGQSKWLYIWVPFWNLPPLPWQGLTPDSPQFSAVYVGKHCQPSEWTAASPFLPLQRKCCLQCCGERWGKWRGAHLRLMHMSNWAFFGIPFSVAGE